MPPKNDINSVAMNEFNTDHTSVFPTAQRKCGRVHAKGKNRCIENNEE
jgi:hypothetical protein